MGEMRPDYVLCKMTYTYGPYFISFHYPDKWSQHSGLIFMIMTSFEKARLKDVY